MIYREKQKALRSTRTLEKRLRDATTAAEETEKLANNYKEQVKTKRFFCFLNKNSILSSSLTKPIYVYVI
jgi:chaperonin cofactor prefoldin